MTEREELRYLARHAAVDDRDDGAPQEGSHPARHLRDSEHRLGGLDDLEAADAQADRSQSAGQDAIRPAPVAPDRVGRFVADHGWRAAALPVLALLAVIALVTAVRSPEPTRVLAQQFDQTISAAPSATFESPPAPESPTVPQSPTVPESPAVAEQLSAAAGPTPDYLQQGGGVFNVVPGESAVLGSGGEIVAFDVQVEAGIDIDPAAFAARVEQSLGDPRAWVATGDLRFQRIGDDSAQLHVMLVTPNRVESLCPGYNTNGYTSCRNGDRVVINLARWSVGVPDYEGYLDQYRDYVINHEVGHFLGHSHVSCPATGAKAPVMMQQTLGVEPCVLNPWPYPNGPSDDPTAPA